MAKRIGFVCLGSCIHVPAALVVLGGIAPPDQYDRFVSAMPTLGSMH
ncbi:hypothetical protein PC118_g14862 [Phytophthora cactorum]|uniref:Uncharacterized protein n=1 Tax=Phytophthora cactorum TaxID=29920 RepID=A0A8T1FN30_9STRA|nr:hypothetical protein PC118_g14862 [Phytophthora cactorum]KAG3132411.1 hypothetical protein C6341_g22923 [Phytophthora cactorum]KAG3179105.1 hypothetical protein PC128_g16079 [Phytophthora cactorum]